ncbi:hypothetical protein COU62_02375 [Candidatus Pacearchaeota archaeon CG10_big_fil_rev_8_21_14_0_10_35_219]|nr:hypothetical protein [Candidatus Pacearchaeota archaeon]OIO41985.1 MAG: hypothetical protein AUJ63_04515 [Candidatus Pacearchaeota archaeon CG1_02_35_32]PIO07813.1 MAG: hypothetical protein COU62_02375 [Candidatus Pacearchaeota archaeon CG10_big_fil_rev_8_21_14_0_10_35_219]PIY81035.1 MAG: hypothetical protein COY79_04485 [Candidatus Pacearchaeota archaeon CG_4_10_14_0_8_um_filter_35_169]
MRKRQISVILILLILVLPGVAFAEGVSLKSSLKTSILPPNLKDNNIREVIPVTPVSPPKDERKHIPDIRSLIDSDKITKDTLVKRKIISDSIKSTESERFTGNVKIYENNRLINSEHYIEGLNLDESLVEEIKELPQELIKECQTISSPGIYKLENTVYSDSTCFNIESDKVILDCRGNEIIYSMKSQGYAVESNGNKIFALKNCEISQIDDEVKNSPAISINVGKNIILLNNVIKTNALNSQGIILKDTANTLLFGNEIETSGDQSEAILSIWAKNLLVKKNDIITTGDLSHGISITSLLKSTIDSNKLLTSGESSNSINLQSSDESRYINNKIKTRGEDSSSFLVRESKESFFRGNHVYESSGDAFKFIGAESASQEKSKLIGNNLENIQGEDLNLMGATPKSEIVLIGQGVEKYSLPPEGGLYVTIRKPTHGQIQFLEPIIGSGDNGSSTVKIQDNFFEIDSNIAPNLNKPAIVTFVNIPEFNNPVILRNSETCGPPDCEALTPLNQSNVSIRVSRWSNYRIGERPIEEPEEILEDQASSLGGGNGKGCSTVWICEEWSACSEGQQTRTCEKQVEACYASESSKPVETQSCTLSETTEFSEQSQNPIARITGAVVGFSKESPGIAIIIFLALLAGAYLIVAFFRNKNFGKKK